MLSYRSLLNEAAAFIRAWANRSEIVILADTRAAADELVYESAGSGVLGVHRFTLPQLAGAISGSFCKLTQLGSEALAARSLHALNQNGRLSYFAPVARTPGFPKVLATTLAELRAEQIEPGALARTGKPGADLARLLEYYQNELATRSLADLPLVYQLATKAAASAPHRLLGLPVVCLDIDARSRCEREFLAAVLARSPEALNLHLEETAEHAETSLGAARRWVFSPEAPSPPARDDTVEIFAAAGEGMECVEIARRIQELARRKVRFDEIAIVLRDPKRYQTLVEEALRRAAIPAYFSHGTARPDPAGRAFLALLACARERCSASRFAEYLSLGQIPDSPTAHDWEPPAENILGFDSTPSEPPQPTGDEPGLPVPAGWEKLLVDAAVIGGPARWRRRLDGLNEEFRAQLTVTEDDAERDRIQRRIQQLGYLEHYALPLIEKLSALPHRASWGEWLDRLQDLADYSLRWPASVLSVLTELEPMDQVGPVDLEEVYGVLEDRLRFFRREPEGRRYGFVFVCSIDEVRGRSFPVVFLPGLAEGVFPRRALENALLLDQYRRQLNAGLALRDDRVADERRRLIGALAAADRKFVVSYPSMDTTLSRPRVPSFYALEIVRAIEGKLPDLGVFKKRTAAAAQTRLSWPAPEEPAVAIDDAEYDLASLKATLDGKADQKGSARYLVEVNQHLGRSLRARGRRWRPSWFDSDGLVNLDEQAHTALQDYRLTRHPYSPSSLQQFASCPYRFALHSIHGLRPREECVALDQMDPLTRGALFHAVQFEFFRELKQRDLAIAVPNLDRLFPIADAVLARVAADYEERLAPAIPRVWATEVEDLKTDLRAWLREVAQRESDWMPLRFEFAFGLRRDPAQPHDPASIPDHAVILNGYRVRGSMDLVEQHRKTGALRVVDHKTGKMPDSTPASVGGGLTLQPLVYALAGESLWEKPVECGRLFYCTQRGGFRKVDIAVTQPGRERLAYALKTIESAVETGFIPAAPASKACDTCDFRAVCGPYEGDRIQRKKQEALEQLAALRSLP